VTQAGLAAPSSLAWSFLTGLVAVPEDVLRQVAPVLLVRLLHHLNLDTTTAAGNASGHGVAASQPMSQVSLAKLLIMLSKSRVKVWALHVNKSVASRGYCFARTTASAAFCLFVTARLDQLCAHMSLCM